MQPWQNPKYLRDLYLLRTQNTVTDQSMYAMGDAVATGNIFLQSQLNKPDPRLRFPLEGHTWFRDIPYTTGGGWVDTETAEFVAGYANNQSLTGTSSNDIGTVEFNRSQDVYNTMSFQRNIRIPLIESLKLAQANKAPNDILDKFVRTDWNKALDRRVYVGASASVPGLLTQTSVTAQTMPNGTQATPSPLWATKNPNDYQNDLNTMAFTAWTNGGNSTVAIPNRLLIPGSRYGSLLKPMTIGSGSGLAGIYTNVLQYLKDNYWGKTFGVDIEIYPLPVWAETAGVGGTARAVAYRFDDDALGFSILQDLTPMGGPLSLQDGAFVKTYIGNLGQVKVFRPQTINYWDGL